MKGKEFDQLIKEVANECNIQVTELVALTGYSYVTIRSAIQRDSIKDYHVKAIEVIRFINKEKLLPKYMNKG